MIMIEKQRFSELLSNYKEFGQGFRVYAYVVVELKIGNVITL